MLGVSFPVEPPGTADRTAGSEDRNSPKGAAVGVD